MCVATNAIFPVSKLLWAIQKLVALDVLLILDKNPGKRFFSITIARFVDRSPFIVTGTGAGIFLKGTATKPWQRRLLSTGSLGVMFLWQQIREL